MSGKEDAPVTNGTSIDPMQRLSSFKPPRNLTLSAAKPNKKVFTPNLNVSRNKTKSDLPQVTRDKRFNDKGKKDKKHDKNKNNKNGPNIIKSSGVFSEGLGTSEKSFRERMSYGRDGDAAPTLQKPTLRVRDIWKVDKDLEKQKVKQVFGDAGDVSDDDDCEIDDKNQEIDAPVRLPLSDGGWLHSKPKSTIKVKQEVKQEPLEVDDGTSLKPVIKVEVKKEVFADTDIVSLLQNDKPTLIMLQFPDTLPGRGKSEDAPAPPRRKQNVNDPTASTSSGEPTADNADKKEEEKCRLLDLEEGKIGKLIIHRSGRVRLALGDSIFEVSAGTQSSFRQEVVSVAADEASRSANIISLGAIPHKLNILPHWETMLAECSI